MYMQGKMCRCQITFSQSGIGKEDFTRLCTEPDFVLDTETLERLMVTMKLTGEERLLLKQTAKAERI